MIGAQVKQLRRAKKVRIRIVLETKLVSFSFIVARILVFIKSRHHSLTLSLGPGAPKSFHAVASNLSTK